MSSKDGMWMEVSQDCVQWRASVLPAVIWFCYHTLSIPCPSWSYVWTMDDLNKWFSSLNQVLLIRSFVNYLATLFQLGMVWEVCREWGAVRILMDAVSLERPELFVPHIILSADAVAIAVVIMIIMSLFSYFYTSFTYWSAFSWNSGNNMPIIIHVVRFKLCMHFPTVPCVLRVLPIPYFLILLPWYLKNTNYETFHEFYRFLCCFLCVRSKYSPRCFIL